MQNILKLSIVAFTALTLISCSGSGSSSSSSSGTKTPPKNQTLPMNNGSSNSSNVSNQTNQTQNSGNYSMGEGYVLPPMPNKWENSKTLLGIDSNNNGVRDDVEHYIYKRFQGYKNARVEQEIAMQWARYSRIIIQNPETAYEDKTYYVENRVIDCQWYYYDTYLENLKNDYPVGFNYRQEHKVFNNEFKDVVFNTRERLKAFFRYNESLSGHVYDSRPRTKDNCDFNPDPLIEGRL